MKALEHDKKAAKEFIDSNVWDGEDRIGATSDMAIFNPDELQSLVFDLIGHIYESDKKTREEEIEGFERMISNEYKNMEKIEKSGENYMHSRTNTAFWVWLARAGLDR